MRGTAELRSLLDGPRLRAAAPRAATELRSPLAIALALTGGAMFFGRGAGDSSLPWLGAAALIAIVYFVATQPLPGRLVTLAPLAALAVWCAVSIVWSVEPDRSWSYANRGLVYLAFALVGAFAVGRPRELMLGLAGLLGAVCIWALAGKVFPWLYEDYGRIARLRGPVGYWNGLAFLGDLALPLALCIAIRWRTAGVLLAYGWICALGLTYSRGGVIVGVVVVAAWIALSRAWLDAIATLFAAGVPAAGVLAIAFLLPGVTSDGQPHSTRVQDGLLFGAAVVGGAAIAAALARLPRPESVRSVRLAALGLVAVIAALAIGVGAVKARSWWDSFTAPVQTELPNTPNRFVEGGSNHRWVWWKEAWHGWERDRVGGSGAGSFELTNLRFRTTNRDSTTEPHSLPVQFLTETGIIGLLLFLGAVGTLVWAAPRTPGPQLALALALPAYFLHGLFDIDWDFVAVSAPVFLVAGSLAVRPPETEASRQSVFAVLTVGGFALAVVFSLFSVWLSARWTGQAEEALGSNPVHAVSLAQRARSLNPLAVEPLFVQALAEQAQAAGKKRVVKRRHLARALGLLEKATQVQPENKDTWFNLGEFNFRVRHCPRTALRQLNRFTELDRQDSGNAEYAAALKQVNSGLPIC
jgi:O-antigen ligase/polysaccharide polymerase Wzy-like membrane protein